MEKQANSRECFVCGVKNAYGLHLNFYWDGEKLICDHIVPERFNGYPGIVHGGVVASMLDEMLGRVFMGETGKPRFMYTARLMVHYRKHVPIGKPLHMEAYPIKDRGRVAESKAKLFGPEGDLLAEAEGLVVSVPPEQFAGLDMEELGWKVYPDDEEKI